MTESVGPFAFLGPLAEDERYHPVGMARTVDKAREVIEQHAPDVVLAEVNTIERLTSWIAAGDAVRATALVVMSDIPAEVALLPCMATGARGFVHMPAIDDVVLQALVEVGAGHVFLDPSAAAWLVEFTLARCLPPQGTGLTVRQAQVLGLVNAGLTNTQIAELLAVSSETVKSHVHRAMRLLGVRNRVEAARKARARQA